MSTATYNKHLNVSHRPVAGVLTRENREVINS